MIEKKQILGHEYSCSMTASDFFCDDPIKQANLHITLDLMQNCLDTIYDHVVSHYPQVYKPTLYIADSNINNAFAIPDTGIVVTTGLILNSAKLIEERYTESLLNKYLILQALSIKEIHSYIRVYLWRYIVLHELYHLWHGHSRWSAHYHFDRSGNLVRNSTVFPLVAQSEHETFSVLGMASVQSNLTQQAKELEADGSAVCMLINLLLMDADARKITDKKQYITEQIALIFGAISTVYCLFTQNSGADFSVLNHLTSYDHPLPSIRMIYAEEVANGMLCHYFPNIDELRDIESEWQKIVCDVEPEFRGKIDMGQVFYYTAYTEKAQRHLCAIKKRMNDMYDSLTPFVLGNRAPKPSEDEICFNPNAVWFTDDGTCINNWINPATGKPSAIKAKPTPVTVPTKIGRNEPCPCGSGYKFKKCTCSEYHH